MEPQASQSITASNLPKSLLSVQVDPAKALVVALMPTTLNCSTITSAMRLFSIEDKDIKDHLYVGQLTDFRGCIGCSCIFEKSKKMGCHNVTRRFFLALDTCSTLLAPWISTKIFPTGHGKTTQNFVFVVFG